jgi:hypothetical protein
VTVAPSSPGTKKRCDPVGRQEVDAYHIETLLTYLDGRDFCGPAVAAKSIATLLAIERKKLHLVDFPLSSETKTTVLMPRNP